MNTTKGVKQMTKLNKLQSKQLFELFCGKTHFNYYTGTGRYSKKSTDHVSNLCSLLKSLNIKFEKGNDAKCGGHSGDFIKISKRASKFKKEFCEKYILENEVELNENQIVNLMKLGLVFGSVVKKSISGKTTFEEFYFNDKKVARVIV